MKSREKNPNAWCVKIEDIIEYDLDLHNPLDIEETIDLSPHDLIKQIITDEKKTLELLTDVENLINQVIPK